MRSVVERPPPSVTQQICLLNNVAIFVDCAAKDFQLQLLAVSAVVHAKTSKQEASHIRPNNFLFPCYRYQVLASSAGVRRQLYELEHGVCELCKVDAALQFRTVKSLAAGEERLQFLMQTEHRLRGRLDKMLIDPKEGDFWQVF